MSITARFQSWGNIVGDGIPGWRGPISSITLLISLRSWKSCHSSLPGFLMTKTGEFQGDVVSWMFPLASCSCTSCWSAFNFCLFSSHCSTQTGVSDSQFNFWVGRPLVTAARKTWGGRDVNCHPPLGHQVSPPQGFCVI